MRRHANAAFLLLDEPSGLCGVRVLCIGQCIYTDGYTGGMPVLVAREETVTRVVYESCVSSVGCVGCVSCRIQ